MSDMAMPVAQSYVIPRRVGSHRARQVVNYIMTGLCAMAVVVALVPLASVLWLVVAKGAHSLSARNTVESSSGPLPSVMTSGPSRTAARRSTEVQK